MTALCAARLTAPLCTALPLAVRLLPASAQRYPLGGRSGVSNRLPVSLVACSPAAYDCQPVCCAVQSAAARRPTRPSSPRTSNFETQPGVGGRALRVPPPAPRTRAPACRLLSMPRPPAEPSFPPPITPPLELRPSTSPPPPPPPTQSEPNARPPGHCLDNVAARSPCSACFASPTCFRILVLTAITVTQPRETRAGSHCQAAQPARQLMLWGVASREGGYVGRDETWFCHCRGDKSHAQHVC